MAAVEELLAKYIENTNQIFSEIKLPRGTVYVDIGKVGSVIDMAKRYVEDAKYHWERKKFETGLVSVAYGEGLLDALRLLDIAEFQWAAEKKKRLHRQ